MNSKIELFYKRYYDCRRFSSMIIYHHVFYMVEYETWILRMSLIVPVFTCKGNVYFYTILLWFYHQIKMKVKDEIKLSNFL